ncbi:putative LysR family transcriptional regulator [Plesiocystis pacifica SIR-1]|uniref:Putative LysR family transcriptional regulator n=1 Tax=Plesiocystis pacifica SIR-1 TaxID=391625 RepID=A6G3S9_9BACT|nr:LysR family transcriptional regulator [Plesiocystis pacifica]EDM79466.1 putative LysR family transcriptional regulator [Plesiocystis pacifica SIR-1]
MSTQAKLNEILIFMAVADAGTFVGGGRALGLTGSAASKAVLRLESRLGAKLLYRTTRAVSLTDEGRAFYKGGVRIVEAIEAAESSVGGDVGEPRGTLRLTVPDAFGRRVLMPLVRGYLERWPSVRVEISFTDRPVDLVEEGFDLAIRIGGASASEGLISRVVARYEVFMCASQAYLDAEGTPRTLGELEAHEGIVFRSGTTSQAWTLTSADGERARHRPRSRVALDSGEAIRDATLAGLGIGYLPEFLVGEDLGAGRLVRLLPEIDAGVAQIVALYPSKRMLEPRVRQFIDLVIAQLPHPSTGA